MKDRVQLCDWCSWSKYYGEVTSGCMNKIENVQNMSQKINWCYLSRKLCPLYVYLFCKSIIYVETCSNSSFADVLWAPCRASPKQLATVYGKGGGGNGRGMLCVVGSWRSGAINCFWINWACQVCLGTTENIHSKTVDVEASVINFVFFLQTFFLPVAGGVIVDCPTQLICTWIFICRVGSGDSMKGAVKC